MDQEGNERIKQFVRLLAATSVNIEGEGRRKQFDRQLAATSVDLEGRAEKADFLLYKRSSQKILFFCLAIPKITSES